MTKSLRAKGTLISEPRLSIPCEMRFSHARKGKRPLLRVFFEKAVFPFSRAKNRISQGVEDRGSLISVPLALGDHYPKGPKSEIIVDLGPPGLNISSAPPTKAPIFVVNSEGRD